MMVSEKEFNALKQQVDDLTAEVFALRLKVIAMQGATMVYRGTQPMFQEYPPVIGDVICKQK